MSEIKEKKKSDHGLNFLHQLTKGGSSSGGTLS